MKKSILILLIPFISLSQEFKFTPEGIQDYIVQDIEGRSQEEIYTKTKLWILDGNFTKLTEISFAILTSISSVVLALKASKVFGGYIEYLKGKIRMLVDVLLEADKHIKDIQVWDIEVINPTLDKLNE